MKTKFPNYRYCIMDDKAGNMNEIWDLKDAKITDEKFNDDNSLHFLTIEEAVKYNKEHPNKILILDKENDPEEIIDYVVNSGAKYIF